MTRLAAIAAKVRQGDPLPSALQRELAGAARRWHRARAMHACSRRSNCCGLTPSSCSRRTIWIATMAERGIAPRSSRGACRMVARIDGILSEATLKRPRGSSACLAWQARRAQRASGLHPRRDAVSPAQLSGRALVSSMARAMRAASAPRADDANGARRSGVAAARRRGRSRNPRLQHRRFGAGAVHRHARRRGA